MPIGYQAVFDTDFADAIGFAAEHRFHYVQFDLNVPRFFLDDLSAASVDRIRAAAADKDVGLSFHAPGDNVSLFTDYPLAREGLLRQMHLILERANQLGARHLTVHPGSPPSFRKAGQDHDAYRSEYWSYYVGVLTDNLRRVADRAGDVLVCVENVGAVDLAFDAMGPLLGRDPPLFLCWDLAKSQGRPEVEAFLRANTAHVREMHAHDVDRAGWQHQIVGEGIVDFRPYADLIQDANIATTIEARPRVAALESRRRLAQALGLA